jgi:hypothetical protein
MLADGQLLIGGRSRAGLGQVCVEEMCATVTLRKDQAFPFSEELPLPSVLTPENLSKLLLEKLQVTFPGKTEGDAIPPEEVPHA